MTFPNCDPNRLDRVVKLSRLKRISNRPWSTYDDNEKLNGFFKSLDAPDPDWLLADDNIRRPLYSKYKEWRWSNPDAPATHEVIDRIVQSAGFGGHPQVNLLISNIAEKVEDWDMNAVHDKRSWERSQADYKRRLEEDAEWDRQNDLRVKKLVRKLKREGRTEYEIDYYLLNDRMPSMWERLKHDRQLDRDALQERLSAEGHQDWEIQFYLENGHLPTATDRIFYDPAFEETQLPGGIEYHSKEKSDGIDRLKRIWNMPDHGKRLSKILRLSYDHRDPVKWTFGNYLIDAGADTAFILKDAPKSEEINWILNKVEKTLNTWATEVQNFLYWYIEESGYGENLRSSDRYQCLRKEISNWSAAIDMLSPGLSRVPCGMKMGEFDQLQRLFNLSLTDVRKRTDSALRLLARQFMKYYNAHHLNRMFYSSQGMIPHQPTGWAHTFNGVLGSLMALSSWMKQYTDPDLANEAVGLDFILTDLMDYFEIVYEGGQLRSAPGSRLLDEDEYTFQDIIDRLTHFRNRMVKHPDKLVQIQSLDVGDAVNRLKDFYRSMYGGD